MTAETKCTRRHVGHPLDAGVLIAIMDDEGCQIEARVTIGSIAFELTPPSRSPDDKCVVLDTGEAERWLRALLATIQDAKAWEKEQRL